MFKFQYFVYSLPFLALSFVYAKNAIHMFQQNRYEFLRYTKWLLNTHNLRFSIILFYVILMVVSCFLPSPIKSYFVLAFTIIFAIIVIYKEDKKEYIKPLVYTDRVKREIVVFTVIEFICIYCLTYLLIDQPGIVGIAAIYLPYLLIYLMAIITLPVENAIKKGFENEARSILSDYNTLMKVGVTGSFGKTTTKNVVKDIIGNKYYTLITPASYNTPMGITRTIREYLKPIYELFICEMGADHVGEISYLMDFVKPKYGIVTSIGPQHLNTFGSMKNIINEKMAMIEKLPGDGVGIINYDNDYIRSYKIKNACKIIKIGINNDEADFSAYDVSYSKEGSSFKVLINDEECMFQTVLLGEHNITNLLFGIALGHELGMSNKELIDGVDNVKQVEHRLELKKINGYTFIDNAFNSNPISCKRSLDVLKMMDGQRIIVTPGLIDLGNKENEYNHEFGAYIKDRADFTILVGEKNSAYVHKGLIESGYDPSKILIVNNVKEAFDYIYNNFTYKDVVLLENDLPDAFLY